MPDNYTVRLLNPKFELIKSRFQCEIPKSLFDLYSNRRQIVRANFTVNWKFYTKEEQAIKIARYVPIDENCFGNFEGFTNYIEIANIGGEGIYFIDPTEVDPEMYLFVMDSYELYPLHLSLSKFVELSKG